MFDFYLLYQPKVREKQIVALEALLRPLAPEVNVFEYIASRKDTVCLDEEVIQLCLKDIATFNITIPVSVNIHPSSILDDNFIQFATEKLTDKNVIIELVEYQHIDIDSHFISNAKILKKHNIKVSVDDFGKDFARTDIAIAIEADEVKFDRALVQDINNNYIKFKHLCFLYSKIKTLCTHNIVFEGVETKEQKDLIELFAEKPIIQGFYYYKPMPLQKVVDLNLFSGDLENHTKSFSKIDGTDLDYLLYQAAKKKELDLGDKEAITRFIQKNDILGLVHNDNPDITLTNLRDIYFNDSSVLRNGIMSLIDSNEKLVIIRNSNGVVIYDNKAHQHVLGDTTLVGIKPKDIIESSPDYQLCIDQDRQLIFNENALYHIDEEDFNGDKYHTIREKLTYNNRHFVITNVCPYNKGLTNITKDNLTGCQTREFLNQDLGLYNNCLLAFLDLNGFKKVNDSFGHEAGDQCLIEFTCILRSMLRDRDTVIRYGGDEFIILFDSNHLNHIDNRLINLNESVKTFFRDIGYKLSFSYGLSLIENNDIAGAIRIADEKMYQNKKESKQLDQLVLTD